VCDVVEGHVQVRVLFINIALDYVQREVIFKKRVHHKSS
jgi:hypothetical protein